jgi:hypothetical protein
MILTGCSIALITNTLHLSSLRRLGLHRCELQNSRAFFTLETLPNLRTLSLHQTTLFRPEVEARDDDDAEEEESDSVYERRELDSLATLKRDVGPVGPQLKALSLSLPGSRDDFELLVSLEVLDLALDEQKLEFGSLPALRVLRLRPTLDAFEIALTIDDLAELQRCRFPRLQELHLFDFKNEGAEQEVIEAAETWSKSVGVRLLVYQREEDDMDLDQSFWQFIDDVKARLKLDI